MATILRTVRNALDFDYENLQAQMNRQLGHVEMLYMVANEKFRLISPTLIHEIATYREDCLASFQKKSERFF